MNIQLRDILIFTTIFATSGMAILLLADKKNLYNALSAQIQQVVFAQTQQYFSVKDFGAIGDGINDDTTAIQATIDFASQAGGGVVFFPTGNYKVSINPSTFQALAVRSNLTLQGAGNEETIIKIADGQGNYSTIIGGENLDTDLSDFAVYDMTIDGNGINNPVAAESDLSLERMRYAIRVYSGRRITIERCRFINQNNANVITVNGYVAPYAVSVGDVKIKNNIFASIGGGDVDYDHSSIYTHGENIEISGNSFASRDGAGTKGARTAIEIHGDRHTVNNNTITGFTNGIYVTGVASSSDNQIITNNNIQEAYVGITIWSFFGFGNVINPAISNNLIENNTITLNIGDWRDIWGDTPSGGIVLEAESDAPIKNLRILNNEIKFTNYYVSPEYSSDNLGNGIRLWRYTAPDVNSDDINIYGNQIRNSLGSGINIDMNINGLEISNNFILNSGQKSSSFHEDYRAAILLGGNLQNTKINNNYLEDAQVNNTMTKGVISNANCVNQCQASGNQLIINSGATLELFKFAPQRENNWIF